MDRFKCPFHGPIRDRDAEGQPAGGPSSTPSTTTTDKKKKKRTVDKLRSDVRVEKTGRARLEKVVFNKSAVKRVARRLDTADAKRTKSLFSEQFNYSM